MAKKFNHDDFIKSLITKYPDFLDKFDIINEYQGNKIEMNFKCKRCGKKFQKTPMNMMKHDTCPWCEPGNKYTQETFEFFVKRNCGNEFDVIGNYVNGKTSIRMRHNLQNGKNHEFDILPETFIQTKTCAYCSTRNGGKKTKTQEEFENEVKEFGNNEYTVVGEYFNNKEKIKIKHEICGTVYEVMPINFLRNNRCPKCFGTPKKTTNEFKKEVKELVGDEYEVLGEYEGALKKIKIKHNKCGNIYNVMALNFLHGNRCPDCMNKSESNGEKEILKFIQQYYPKANKKRFFPNKNNKSEYFEADICIEDKKLVIEYDGLYWHSIERLKKRSKDEFYHINKTNFFNSIGYRTIHIFEDEWINKKDIVKEKLSNILDENKQDKILVKECIIREISVSEVINFSNQYSIEDELLFATINEGLFYNDKLVGIISFNNINHTAKLIQYITSIIIIDGFKELLEYCTKKYNFTKIIGTIDLRWESKEDNIFNILNFKVLKISEPNYWYIKLGRSKRYNNNDFKKEVLKEKFPNIYSDKLTEFEIMKNAGYNKIYDCGNISYIKEIKKN